MASITFSNRPDFPSGTTVDAYPLSAFPKRQITSDPEGNPAATTTVDDDGAFTFSGLTEDVDYVATFVNVTTGERISFRFLIPRDWPSPLVAPGGTSGQFLAKASDDDDDVFWAAPVLSGTIDVTSHGATGDGATDDTEAIQYAIDHSEDGSTIYFPPGVYGVSAPVVMKGLRTYEGAGYARGSGATIKQIDGANIANDSGEIGLFVPEAWDQNLDYCDNPLLVVNLAFDGNYGDPNPDSNASGILLYNFWSRIERCYVHEVPANAVLLTDMTRDGTIMGNSASENTLHDCKFVNMGGSGLKQTDNGNDGANLDGHIVDCYISDFVETGISLDRAAGWSIRRAHMYGVGKHGIMADACYATDIECNYIEEFGGANFDSEEYFGIRAAVLDGRGATVVNNIVSCEEPSDNTSTYTYIGINAKDSQSEAQASVMGNVCSGANTAQGTAYKFDNDSGGVMHARCVGNQSIEVANEFVVAGDHYVTTDFARAGSPEGVVTGNPGDQYRRSDGSTSTSLYVKTSGTGNTGWTAK